MGACRRSQPIVEQEGARHPAGVQGVCGDDWAPQCPGALREWICPSPCDVGTSSRSPRSCCGEQQCCGWALPGGHCSHCPVLPAAEQGQLLVALSPTVVPSCQGLSRTTSCVYISLFSLSALGAGWLMVASLIALGREAGDSQAMVSDSQARAVLWPHVLVTEHGKKKLLTLTWLSEPRTAAFSASLPAARQEFPVVSVWRWVCAGVSG